VDNKTIKGTTHPTGITASNAEGGMIEIRVDHRGTEIGLVGLTNGVYWKPKDTDRIIYELIKVRDAMEKEGLLT
jgi:hypothetical protein